MAKQPTRLIPLRPYIVGGQIAFIAIIVGLYATLVQPFTGFYFGAEWRVAIPHWGDSLRSQAPIVIALLAIAYLLSLGGAVAAWAFQERKARRYVRLRRH